MSNAVSVPVALAPYPALWDVKACAAYLLRSPRWVWACLTRRPEEAGSIPHVRLPGGAPRFVPGDVAEWVALGCPPAATFKAWQDAAKKRNR